MGKQKVNKYVLTRKYHNHTLQTNPGHDKKVASKSDQIYIILALFQLKYNKFHIYLHIYLFIWKLDVIRSAYFVGPDLDPNY